MSTEPATRAAPMGTNGTEATAPGGASGAPAVAPAAPAQEAESSEFLRNLVDAMRGVAETSRDANLAELRTAVDTRVEELRAAAAAEAEELRQRSEQDITAIGDWEKQEIARVRTEAESKRETRLAELEQQLAEHQAASDREVESTRRRLADHERDLASFFTQLAEISDPAAFVAAAKRMPQPPRIASAMAGVATPTDTGVSNPRLASMGTDRPMADEPATTSGAAPERQLSERLAELRARLGEAAPAAPTSAATEQTAPAVEAVALATETDTSAPEPADEPVEQPAATSEAATSEAATSEAAAVPEAATPDAASPEAAQAPAAVVHAGSDTSTAIVVKGLGSFGAITSFKQALERVEGVRGVTLSLGPTGEFVYRASHGADFDLAAAIRTIEGDGANIERSDGSLLVTVSRSR